jgi:hypothetical protein
VKEVSDNQKSTASDDLTVLIVTVCIVFLFAFAYHKILLAGPTIEDGVSNEQMEQYLSNKYFHKLTAGNIVTIMGGENERYYSTDNNFVVGQQPYKRIEYKNCNVAFVYERAIFLQDSFSFSSTSIIKMKKKPYLRAVEKCIDNALEAVKRSRAKVAADNRVLLAPLDE